MAASFNVIVISSDEGSPQKVFTPTKRKPVDSDSESDTDGFSPSLLGVSAKCRSKRIKLEEDSSDSHVDLDLCHSGHCSNSHSCVASVPPQSRGQSLAGTRIIIEESDGSELGSDADFNELPQEYYDDDKELPVYVKSMGHGYPIDSVIHALLPAEVNESVICKVQPLGVTKNTIFLIDLDAVHFEDLKADDLGSWTATGTKRTYFRYTNSKVIHCTAAASPKSCKDYLLLTRRYYVHKTHKRFHRIISDIRDNEGSQNRYGMIQYYFDGPEVEIKIKPHGNSKTNDPFFRTAHSAMELHKEMALRKKPKDVIHQATTLQGGEMEAKGLSLLPRNRQQIANYRRSHMKKDDNVLYSVMLECKLVQGTQEAFVRDVKAAPDPQCIMFFDWQLSDVERFIADDDNCHGILTVDTTYNLGQFYVTPTTYPHLMVENIVTKKHPSLLGPVLVHQRLDFATFNYFCSTLVSFSKKLRSLQAFGSDGHESLIDAFSHVFPKAKQLRCFIHFRKNISGKLKEYGVPTGVAEEILNDIFGVNKGSTYYEGLVDSTSVKEFDSRLERCESKWNEQESAYAPSTGPRFYDYFVRYKADVVKYTMLQPHREAVGLGSPPSIFTTNASESINALMKRKVDYKESEWPQFNDELKQLVSQQREEVIRALSGRGQYRLLQQYTHFSVTASRWMKMRPEQRCEVVSQFDKASLQSKRLLPSIPVSDQCSSSISSPAIRNQSPGPSSSISSPAAIRNQSPGPSSSISSPAIRNQSPGPSSSISSPAKYNQSPGPSEEPSRRRQLAISAGESGITKMSLTTLQFIWQKAEELINAHNAITQAPGQDGTSKMVISYSSSTPHHVTKRSNGQYKCDANCINWASSGICSHLVAVSELNGDLKAFIEWYNASSCQPNITTLANKGLSAGRGRKGGVPKRKRSSKSQKSTPEVSVPRPAFCNSYSPPNVTPLSPFLPISQASPPAISVVGQMNYGSSIIGCTSNVNPSTGSVFDNCYQPNLNPFYVKPLHGNIRICQGCRTSLRLPDGTVPFPPFDFVIGRSEKRSYRDKNGILVTPRQEQTSHYHLKIECVRAVEPTFVGFGLSVPPDVKSTLTRTHVDYLFNCFGLVLF